MRKKLYILDVSGFIFRAYFALPPMTNSQGESTHALFGFIRSTIKLFKELKPEHVVAVFDGPDNKKQRRELYEKYKSNRTQIVEDLPGQIDKAMEFCALMGLAHVEISGVEADDTMGSIALWAEEQGMDVFLCTGDKDFAQLVSNHIFILNPWKENLILDKAKVEEVYGVPPERIIDLLAIMGDSSDNIPGLTGFGPKTAIALLKEFGSLENILKNPGLVPGKKKQETLKQEADIARLSHRLATIHTAVDFPKDSSCFALKPPQVIELRDFYMAQGFGSLVRELDEVLKQTLPATALEAEKKVSYLLVDDEAALELLLRDLRTKKEICFDVESTHIRPLLASPVGIGFCVAEGEAAYVPLNGKLGKKRILEALKPLFEDTNHSFFGHNVKYDCHVLANEGIQVASLSFDTILASYLLNSESRRHSLDHLALQYFGKVKISIKSLIGAGKKEITMDQVPLEKVCEYCCEDVDYTFRIKAILEKELLERELGPLLFDLELPLSIVLAKMERVGIYVDVEKLHTMSKEIRHELVGIEKEIHTIAGEEFNISSPKQLSEILFTKLGIKPLKKTATGLSTRAEVLESLAAEHLIAQKIIEFRLLEKLRSTYIDSLPDEVHPISSRIHPTFNQWVAATGRLSCQDPNLQNIPIRSLQGKKIREAFRPQKKGWSYLSADYSQIELRLLAHLSEDPELIKAFKEGEDIHEFTASLIFNIPLAQVTPTQRHQAKAINFGIIYGQQAYGLSQELGIEVKEAAAFIQAYFERYPKVLSFIAKCVKVAHDTGMSTTMIGRQREILDIRSKNAMIRAAAERLAINTPLQGSAADLIKLAMLDIDRKLVAQQLESTLILQIHDELIFEAPDSELDSLKTLVKKSMEGVFTLKVPLIVDIHIGKNWGEC